MKAIILAAGMGSRLKEITKDIPKCLIEINGTPIIKKQIESLNANNIFDISIIVGYKEALVKQSCNGLNLKFYTNQRFKETGMLNSLFCAEKEMDNEFLMIYGDVYFEKETLKEIINCKEDFCLLIDANKQVCFDREQAFEEYNNQKIRKGSTKVYISDGRIKKISKELKEEETSGEYFGVAKFSKRGALVIHNKIKSLIDSGEIEKFPSPSYLFEWLIQKGERIIPVYLSQGGYAELDYLEDLENAKKMFENKKINAIIFDAEGVLYYRDEETLKPLIDFFSQKGYKISLKQFKEAYEKDSLALYKKEISKDEHLRLILEHLGINYDSKFLKEFESVFRRCYSDIKIDTNVIDLLKNLKEKSIKIGVLTDTFASKEQKIEWFTGKGLIQYIDEIACSSETGFTKDSPQACESILKMLNVSPKEALFVGHKEYEMRGARKANVKSASIVKGVGEDIFLNRLNEVIYLL